MPIQTLGGFEERSGEIDGLLLRQGFDEALTELEAITDLPTDDIPSQAYGDCWLKRALCLLLLKRRAECAKLIARDRTQLEVKSKTHLTLACAAMDALGRGDPVLLRAATERFSQGLDHYSRSALPRLLALIEERIPAGMIDLRVPLDHHDYSVTSYSLWRSGLAAMVAGSYQGAHKYFRESMKRYELGQMDADVLWSWFDAILALLMQDQLPNAEQLYLLHADRATTSQPHFETASKEVIKAYRERDPESVLRAQGLMAHKWAAFKDSEYPAIFRAFELKIGDMAEPKSSIAILTPAAVSERRHRVLVCRPAVESDVDRLIEIAQEVNLGNTRPDEKSILEQIAICKNTLTGNISWEQGILYLATEITSDQGGREVVGSCKLQKMVEGCWAKVTHQRVARMASEGRRRAEYDQLAYDSSKMNALEFSGTAVLQAYRNQGIGTFHVQARLLFLLTHVVPGVKYLYADLLTDSLDNTFPFYETIVRPLIGRDIDYDRADTLRYYDIQFFEALLGKVGDSDPPVQIPLHVLPPDIRRGLGKVRDQTMPAKRVLTKYGFRETQKFDLLDGGQYMEVQLDELRRSNFDQELTAKRSPHTVAEADPTVAFTPLGRSPSDFFAVRAQTRTHEREMLIPTHLYRELEIQRDEIVRVIA